MIFSGVLLKFVALRDAHGFDREVGDSVGWSAVDADLGKIGAHLRRDVIALRRRRDHDVFVRRERSEHGSDRQVRGDDAPAALTITSAITTSSCRSGGRHDAADDPTAGQAKAQLLERVMAIRLTQAVQVKPDLRCELG